MHMMGGSSRSRPTARGSNCSPAFRVLRAAPGWLGEPARLLRNWAVGLAVAVVCSCATATFAGAAGRNAAMAVDANTGQILHAEAADEPRYPASLTKMMTLYLVFEQLEAGRLKPETRIIVSPVAASVSPSKLGVPAGQSIAVTDAVKALITKSANDIAVALAEHIAGDEAKFAALMTRKARDLGMTATTFRNAHGLPDASQRTSARDMITLALRLHDHFPRHVRLFSLRSFAYAGRLHRNHNTMLESFPGMEGMKTGYTTASGYNLVASVRRDGRHVIAAVFGGQTAGARNAQMRLMLARSLPRASTEVTRKPQPVPLPLVANASPVPTAPRLAERIRVNRAEPRQAADAVVQATARTPEPARTPAPAREVEPSRAPAPVMASSGGARTQMRLAIPVGDGVSMASLVPSRPASARGETEPVRPPSSLQAQASSLGLQQPQAASVRQDGGAPAAIGVHIQIGAFAAEQEAREKLDLARQRSPRHLARAGLTTPAVIVNGRRLFRARFTGLSAETAASACSELRRQQIDCLVTRAE